MWKNVGVGTFSHSRLLCVFLSFTRVTIGNSTKLWHDIIIIIIVIIINIIISIREKFGWVVLQSSLPTSRSGRQTLRIVYRKRQFSL